MAFAILVLNYHSTNISGNSYETNDHVALRTDLNHLTETGWTIWPLYRVVEAVVLKREPPPPKVMALSFDDGTDFDFVDLMHPTCGMQRSLCNVLHDHQSAYPDRQPNPHATAFVIVSPDARAELDQKSMIGAKWWNDHWWKPAIDTGLIGIANHSWDHNHPLITRAIADSRPRGTFTSIDDFATAEDEIARAAAHIRAVAANPSQRLFAYPYGEGGRYLEEEYLPQHAERIGVDAAFTSCGGPITEASTRWRLPRYTCGQHWKTHDDLRALLREIAR